MSTDLETARENLDAAITRYAKASGRGNEIVTSWLLVGACMASDIEDGDVSVLVTVRQHQPYITNLGLAAHAYKHFRPKGDAE